MDILKQYFYIILFKSFPLINRLLLILLLAIFAVPSILFAQTCPENIGFENGNFQNWKLFSGNTSIVDGKNSVSLAEINMPALGRQTIISDKTTKDKYGDFTTIPSSGGAYSVKLGNDGTGAQVEGISYLINVPSNRPEFTLTYQYAVVLEDPNHSVAEQPRFIARVKDVETNQYIPCASFEYIATSNLPGFKKSKISSTVIYKDWTPVTINLSGYQGKHLLLEFISADCTLGGHFGYAYVDVNNLCGDLIVGNTFCKSADKLNISGPSGFQDYKWYNEDKSVSYGSGQSIVLKPAPAEGSKIILDLIPYTGFGCPSSISAVIHSVDYQLQVVDKKTVCQNVEIDLTSNDYILNKSDQFTYFVFEDKDLTQMVKGLAKVNANKTYYIQATNFKGCESVATIDLSVFDVANVTAKNPEPVCYDQTVDLTQDNLYVGNLEGTTRLYFTDENTLIPIADPKKIKLSGKYFIKISNGYGCSKVIPLEVTINAKPTLQVVNTLAVCFPSKVDLTNPENFKGSDLDLTYSFFSDVEFSNLIADPKNIDKSGTYYILAKSKNGCTVSGKVDVVINELPILVVSNPKAVCSPEKVDITSSELYNGSSNNLAFLYYYDAGLANKIAFPKAIDQTGTYYVKASNANGCYVVSKINVEVNPLPYIVLNKPKTIFDNDFIDLTATEITKGSKDFVKVKYFEDAGLTKPLANPTRVNKNGLFYIEIQNAKGCSVASPIEIIVLPSPKIIVPTAFTPQKETNNRLFPFLVSIQKLISFKVFNKWGILVYQTDTLASGGWDGQFKSKLQPLETFSWFAEGIDTFGSKFQSTGKTILIL